MGGVPISAGLLNLLTYSYNPVLRGLEVIEKTEIGQLRLEDDELTVGGE